MQYLQLSFASSPRWIGDITIANITIGSKDLCHFPVQERKKTSSLVNIMSTFEN